MNQDTATVAGRGASTPEAPAPAGEFGWSLTALLREWTARVEAAVGDLPHGTRGYLVLSTVVRDTPPSQAALAARLGIDRTVMTYLIDAYVKDGLVERQQDPADRRARRIVPTERGRAVLAEMDSRVRAAEADLLGGVEEAERAVLCRLLAQAANGVAHDEDHCAAVATGPLAAREPG